MAARRTRLLERDTVTVVVQVNGKVRDSIEVARERPGGRVEAGRARARRTCSATSRASRSKREVVVPGRLVNFVVK